MEGPAERKSKGGGGKRAAKRKPAAKASGAVASGPAKGAAPRRPAAKPGKAAARSRAAKPKPKAKPRSASKPVAGGHRKRRASERGAAAAAPKDPSRDLWFRFSTRVRAAGYWLREKGQWLAGRLGPARERAEAFWAARSTPERAGIAAAGALVLALALVRILPVPGVPCQVSVKECAPEQRSLGLVPADALMYAHLTLDRDSDQFERASEHFDRLPDLRTILTAEIPAGLSTPSGAPLDLASGVLPWAERDLAVMLLPGRRTEPSRALIAGVGDRDGAERFLAEAAPPGQPRRTELEGVEVSSYRGGLASAFVSDSLLFGDAAAVRGAVAAAEGDAPSLADEGRSSPLDELPEARFAEVYLSPAGMRRLLAGEPGAAEQLETFVDYGASEGMAAAAVAEQDGLEISLVSELDPKQLKRSPSFFSGLPAFEPSLAELAGERALAYVGAGEVGPTLAELLRRAGRGGVAGSLRGLFARLRREAGVDPLAELLPALGGQAALVAEPTDRVPYASLIVDDVDEDEAAEALAALQRPLLRAIGTSGGVQVRRFEESEVEGITVRSVQASPTVNLSYALFDGRLVVSTDPAGIAQVAGASGDSLADAEPFQLATDGLPESVSALVFLNLDELFAQVTRTDLVEDPFFANLSVLFDNATSLALAVEADDERISSQLFLAID